jgi:pyruvate ferredoxin oxidoreductase gamma subunit
MKYHKDIFEIIFYARGGQGAKVAAEIIAQAAVKEGKFVQAFPQFGPERSGAPTKTFVRISEKEIRTHEPVTDPDVVVVLDETIIDSEVVIKNLSREEALIINTKRMSEEVRAKLLSDGSHSYQGRIYPIDANGISMEIVGQPRPNTVILGKFIQVTEAVQLASVMAEFREIFEQKIGPEATQKNILAIEKAYDTI